MPAAAPPSPPPLLLLEVLLEFLEALVHQVLFVRELYAPELFQRQRLYSIAVRRARHPDLASYIADAVAGLRAPLAAGALAKVAVVVLGPARTPVERFVLEPRLLPSANLAGSEADLDLEAVHAALRGVLLRLQFADASLARLPEGCSFEVVAYTTGRGGATGVPQDAWVEEQPAPGHLELVQAEIVPIKSCSLEGAFQLNLFAES